MARWSPVQNLFSHMKKEKTIKSELKFNGHLIKVDLLKVELGNKRHTRREIVRHPGAVAVLCRLPDGRFAFVRQYRKAIESVLLEIVAGTREPGEAPIICAKREVKEETGYDAGTLEHLGHFFTAPGFCDERIDVYFARRLRSGGRQRPDADEQLELVCLTERQIETRLASGRINDAKTLAAWMMYKMRRQRKS